MKYVRHLKREEWGIGQVIENDKNQNKIKIDFALVGEKLLKMNVAQLKEVRNQTEIDNYTEQKLANTIITKPTKKAKTKRVQIKIEKIIEDFKKEYQDGFKDFSYISTVKASRKATHKKLKELLTRKNIQEAVKNNSTNDLANQLKKIISKSKCIHSIEKTKLRKLVSNKDLQEEFFLLIKENILDVEEVKKENFDKCAKFYKDNDCNKWTIITFFIHHLNPEQNPLLKPKLLKELSKYYSKDINYTNTPNWETYNSYKQNFNTLNKKIEELEPKDYIDIENFIKFTNQITTAA